MAGADAVRLLDGDPWHDAVELHQRLAYVPGDVSLWPKLTGGEIIDLLGERGDSSALRFITPHLKSDDNAVRANAITAVGKLGSVEHVAVLLNAVGDDAIDAKTRSLMNLTMIAALGRMEEWKLHCRGALTNGVSQDELRAAIHIVAVYCGAPAALQCFHAAAPILREFRENPAAT